MREAVVVFGRRGPHAGEPRPRYVWKVVMLVVVPYIPREPVERAVVRVRFLPSILREGIVLRNKVAGARVEAAGKKGAQQQETERRRTGDPAEQCIEGKLRRPVADEIGAHGQAVREQGPKRVGDDLDREPYELARASAEDPRLHSRRDVGVDTVLALKFVVLKVIDAEGGGKREANRQISDPCEHAVVPRFTEEEVVCQLVDGEEEGLGDRGPDHVGCQQVPYPRQPRREDGQSNLRDHERKQANVLGSPVRSVELGHARVRGQYLLAPRRVRLRCVGPNEIVRRAHVCACVDGASPARGAE
mmetsp:Transcript_16040/g.33092  ORF Transcript_16040/g.33092 Transcript_16040/m.33092 type:complete len:303 (-) Transcript_16040:269-1177(-)